MKNFTHFTHESIPDFVAKITHIWDVYGKTNYKLTAKFNHDLVNISPRIIDSTPFGKWITESIGEIDNCKFFICIGNKWGEAHIDGSINPRNCAINIPIANCSEGIMNWFSNDDTTELVTTDKTNVHISKLSKEVAHWSIMDSMTLTQPALVRTNCWHNVDNRLNSNPRIVFSIRLKGNPQFEDILDKIKPWAV